METLWQDFRFGLRSLTKSPAFLAVAVLSLALGVGANTAIFTVVKAVFLQPLPFHEPHRVVMLSTVDSKIPGLLPSSYPNLLDYRERQSALEGIAMIMPVSLSVSTAKGDPETWPCEAVSANFFEILGTKPVLGRVFTEKEEEEAGQLPVAVLSNGTWVERFGADPNIAGKQITINRQRYTVAGVMPPGFKGMQSLIEPSLWAPMSMAQFLLSRPEIVRDRNVFFFYAVARLTKGYSREQAEAALQPVAEQLAVEYPAINRGRKVKLTSVTEAVINPRNRQVIEKATVILMTVVALVLLIACANVAALLLVRARGRSKEFAVRAAVGAGKWRVVRQMLTESLLLSMMGGAVGLLIARWARDLLWRSRPPWIAGTAFDLSLDATVLGYTFLLSLVTGLLFGLAPAMTAWRRDLAIELRERTSQGIYEHRVFGVRSLLVVTQCALSVVALVGAGLFMESLRRMQQIDIGMDAAHLATLRLNVNNAGYNREQGLEYFERITERVSTISEVKSAAVTAFHPLSGGGVSRSTIAEGHENEGPSQLPVVAIGLKYFETAGSKLLAGRDFTSGDRAGTRGVVIVNQTLANRFWPGQSPIGKRLRFSNEAEPREIVGMSADAKLVSLSEDKMAVIYAPMRQDYISQMSLLVNTQGEPRRVLGAIRRMAQQQERNLPLGAVVPITDIVNRSLWAQRLLAGLMAIFGFLALALAAIGVYGLTAYSVSQRTSEIGIRMAMGATPAMVKRHILAQGMTLVIPGIVIGVIGAVASSRIANTLLYGIAATHPPTYLLAGSVLASVALVACYLPARRATRVDPLMALRHE